MLILRPPPPSLLLLLLRCCSPLLPRLRSSSFPNPYSYPLPRHLMGAARAAAEKKSKMNQSSATSQLPAVVDPTSPPPKKPSSSSLDLPPPPEPKPRNHVLELRKKAADFDPRAAAFWKSSDPAPFLFLARAVELISNESRRFVITEILCNVFRTLMATAPRDFLRAQRLTTHLIAPPHKGIELGSSAAWLIKAVAEAYGQSEEQVKKQLKELGDLGLVAKASRSSQKVMFKRKPLTIRKVHRTFRAILEESGKDSQDKKRNHLKGLLVAATDCEPQYIIRLLQLKVRPVLAHKTVQVALRQMFAYSRTRPASHSMIGNSADAQRRFPALSKSAHVGSGRVAYTGSRDDVYNYQNAGTYRVLPPSMIGNFSSGSHSAGASDADNRLGMGEERHMEHDERVIYQQVLQNLAQPELEDDLPEGLLTVPLLKHQKIALAWMVQQEKSILCAGGILADDQGLGKTISMIALINKQMTLQDKFTSDNLCHNVPEGLNLDDEDDGDNEVVKATHTGKDDLQNKPVASTSTCISHKWGPAAGTLVVCPASVLRQWARELDDKVTNRVGLSVLVYHGGTRTKEPSELAKHHIVLTTYSIVTNEVPKQPLVEDDDDEQKNLETYGLCSEFSTNQKRKQNSNISKRRKEKGMGVENSSFDSDGGALSRVRWFRVILDEAQTIKNHRTQVARACCGLQAERRWCLSGTPMQNTIDDLYSYFRFLKYDPYAVYNSFCSSIKHPISRNPSSGYKKLQAVLRTILLRRTKETCINGEPIVNLPPKSIHLKRVDFSVEERAFYLKLEADSRKQFKVYAAAGTVKQNYSSILLMLLRLRQACDHPCLVKGCHSDTVQKESLAIAKQLPREMRRNLLNQLEVPLELCGICRDPPEDAVVAICGHVFCYQCVSKCLTSDDNLCPVGGCKDILGSDSVFSRATLESCISEELHMSATTSSTHVDECSIEQRSYSSAKIKAALEILNSICQENANVVSNECNKGECYPCRDCDHVFEGPSSDENGVPHACATMNSNPKMPVKAIVFSQWTSMLDLLEIGLNQSLIQYRRLDGTMSLASRDRAVKDFNNDPEVTVILMSLKAGNLGLNMVAACHVILLDLWWNPTTEDQAVDRAHRIGQARAVTVSRLAIKDTVEDRILRLQEEKRKMVASAFGEDQNGTHVTRLTEDDLRYLFKV